MKNKNKSKSFGQQIIRIPSQLLGPIIGVLRGEAAKLESKKKDLAKEDPFTDPTRLEDNASIDSEAAEQLGHERTTAMKAQVDRRLVQIRKALSRIKIGKYGICEKCGRMIDTDRLVIMPEATLCVKCSRKKSS